MATNKNEKMDAISVTLGGIYPFLGERVKALRPAFFFNPPRIRGG